VRKRGDGLKVSSERLRRLEVVTDSALAYLGVQELLVELLDRVRELLEVDTTAVLLLDPSSQYLVATAARGLEEEVAQGVRIPLGQGFAGRIALEKRPVYLESVDHENVLNPLLRERGIESLLGVPLVSAGRVLGVLHVGTLTKRFFTAEEVDLLQLVADRIALAVQARILETERSATLALQRSLLPALLPSVPGLEFASRYVASGSSEVGGDWYDVFQLPSGRLWIVIGDVLGRGLMAAATMGRLRSALRAYATEYDDPATVLAKLDAQTEQFEPESMATVLCGVVEPGTAQVRLSSAGHLPPILVCPNSPPRVLTLQVDLPLGVDSTRPRRTSTVPIPDNAALCLYTDGLVERRGQSIDTGIEKVRAVIQAHQTAETLCNKVMAALVGARAPMDDIAVLILRRYDAVNAIAPLPADAS
jgi:sigma-B regulation protein RsbU (phosphoserine phosphatase)